MSDLKKASENLSHFILANDKFLNGIEEIDSLLLNKEIKISRYPIVTSNKLVENFNRICSILNEVLVKIVYNYTRDHRVQSYFQLDDQLNKVLLMAEGTPYEIGMYRSDFILDNTGNPKICEISCRFPSNGWMYSYYMNNALNSEKKTDFIDDFLTQYDKEEPIFFITQNKQNNETEYLKKEIENRGFQHITIHSSELKIENDALHYFDQAARQFYLEVDREELKDFDEQVLKYIISSNRCINDVRSIILVHDKRILALLSDIEVMRSYMYQDDYQFLLDYLIPSYTLHTIENRETLIQSSEDWILKKNSGGSISDTYIKNSSTAVTWRKILEEEWQDYMVQPYIDQKPFEFYESDKSTHIHLTGSCHFLNGKSYGLGVFRGSGKKIINLHQNKTILFPCIEE